MRRPFVLLAALLLPPLLTSTAGAEGLEKNFASPPASAKPQVFWQWMIGNVTREGITADLEAMRRVGMDSPLVMTIAGGAPAGPMRQMNPQFFDMMEHTVREADRLGMTISMHDVSGWTGSGGPWIKPEQAMQFITSSEVEVNGPATFNGKLPQPPSMHNFYRDVAVLAFPTPADEQAVVTPDNPVTITTDAPGVDAAPLARDLADKFVEFPAAGSNRSYYLQAAFAKPVSVRNLRVRVRWERASGGPVQISDDGVNFRTLRHFELKGADVGGVVQIPLSDKPVTARFFRLGFVWSFNSDPNLISQFAFSNRAANPDLIQKGAYERPYNSRPNGVPLMMEKACRRKVDADSLVRRDALVNLTSALQPDGTLLWSVPPGKWTIVRFGHTPTGAQNGGQWSGLECDKFTPDGIEAAWRGMMQPTMDRLGPLVGKTLARCEIDSWEVGGQNWTAKMPEEFRRRRGYDPTPFLPAMTGRTVESPAITERFLWDLRRTVSDLIVENYYRPFAELCRRHGLESMTEPYDGPYESMICGAQVDTPMGEFWQDSAVENVKMVSSIGHGYGKRVVAAEAFTGEPTKHGCWKDDPYSMKAFGDQMFCRGINRFVIHSFVHQPWLNRAPGMTLMAYGINLNRCNTWFEWSGPWMQYLSRCQYMLQRGRAVADVAYFCGQNAPVCDRPGHPPTPAGYYWDDINADLLLNHARVMDRRLVLDSGARYAVLVLPPDDPQMTPELLARMRDLVRDGATLVGSRPACSPSLQGYPDCDRQVQSLAAEMWGEMDGKGVTRHRLGQGQVVEGQSLQTVLDGLGIAPDVALPQGFEFIHRALSGDGDAYFISNPKDAAVHQDCSFRVAGRTPELWHPDTGLMETAPAYTVKDGRTIVPLDFDPGGSIFVVFRKPCDATDHIVTPARELRAVGEPIDVDEKWKLHFPPHWGAPAVVTLDRLISWSEHPDDGVKCFSGTATYEKEVQIPADALGKDRVLWLDLGNVKNLAKVKVNDVDLGILWKPPFRVDIAKDSPLLPSGLLGPVQLVPAELR